MSTEEKIDKIRNFVPRLRALVDGLTDEQLTTAYNASEWTIAQNVHHLVESHINSYIRFKLILTEDKASLRSYNQDNFASLPDAQDAHIEDSLLILEGLHRRWGRMMDNITDWDKFGYHPRADKNIALKDLLETYVWHCNAHYQQIQEVLEKMPS